MRGCLVAISFLFAVSVFGQTVPPPCGEKGVPDNVPCYDAKSGKVIHTETPANVPHQDIPLQPPPAEPVVVPKLQPAKVAPTVTVPPQVPQNWSYQSDASCYHDGDTVQCCDVATLQRYASSRVQFEAQFQAGQVVGEAIGALLVRAWMQHRLKVDLERKDIRQQISTYYNASYELNDEVMHDQDALVVAYTSLAQLDPSRRTLYEQAAKDSASLNPRLAMLRPTAEKNLPGILAAKDLKFLRKNLDLAKQVYNLTLDGAKREYVYAQLMQALVGYYEHQRSAP